MVNADLLNSCLKWHLIVCPVMIIAVLLMEHCEANIILIWSQLLIRFYVYWKYYLLVFLDKSKNLFYGTFNNSVWNILFLLYSSIFWKCRNTALPNYSVCSSLCYFYLCLQFLSIQKLFIVPVLNHTNIPHARVNHNKYMVTDKVAYIGTYSMIPNNYSVFTSTGLRLR